MRMRRPASRSGVEEINVTPLIDVVMCLIIFFLIVGKLAQDGQVGVRLPESGVGRPSEPAEGEFVTVAVRPLSAGGAGGAGADAARWRVTVDGQAPADGGEAALAALLSSLCCGACGAASRHQPCGGALHTARQVATHAGCASPRGACGDGGRWFE